MVATRRKPEAALISSTSSLSPLPFSARTRDFSVSRTLTNTTDCQRLLLICLQLYVDNMWQCVIVDYGAQNAKEHKMQKCRMKYHTKCNKIALLFFKYIAQYLLNNTLTILVKVHCVASKSYQLLSGHALKAWKASAELFCVTKHCQV